MATILEALEAAQYNLDHPATLEPIVAVALRDLAKEQINNAIVLLQKGYSIYDEVEPLLEQYGEVEDVPVKDED